ncbi:hypothetical protein E4U52_006319 [Claviceps spartinae]|nr:hypothetical protein E4U52_006319 [Claviceps spartinae]
MYSPQLYAPYSMAYAICLCLFLEDDPAVKTWYNESRDKDLIPMALDCTRVPSPAILVLFQDDAEGSRSHK